MKKISVFVLLLIACINGFGQGVDYKKIKRLIMTDFMEKGYYDGEKYITVGKSYKFEAIDPLAPGALEFQKVKSIGASGGNLMEDIKGCPEALADMRIVQTESGKRQLLTVLGITSVVMLFVWGLPAANKNHPSFIDNASPYICGTMCVSAFLLKKNPTRKRTIHLHNAVERFNEWIAKENGLSKD